MRNRQPFPNCLWHCGAAIALLLLVLPTTAASARTFTGSIALITGYGLPIPILNPIPGSGAVPTTGPLPSTNGSLAVPANLFSLATGPNVFPLPQPTSFPFLTSTTFGTFSNQAGTLRLGDAPATLTFCPGLGVGPCTNNQGTKPGRMRADMVGAQFGGIMRLAGIFNDRLNIASGAGTLIGTLPIPLSNLGGTTGTTVMAVGTFTHNTLLFTTNLPVTFTFMPWMTGRFRVDDSVGIQASAQTVTGYDLRNASGAGNVQMVSGFLAHLGGLAADDVTGTAVMTMAVPEPRSMLALGSGLSFLGLLFHHRGRRRS